MAKTDKKQPWLKFYPSDWSGDRKLHMCSIGARGLWVEMMCVMHEAEPYGHLVTDGKPVTNRQIASLAGISLSECGRYLMELESAGVYSRTESKTIFSRRMVRDKAKAETDRNNGKGGGNPLLVGSDNEGVNPHDNHPDKAQRLEARSQSSESISEKRESPLSDRDLRDEKDRPKLIGDSYQPSDAAIEYAYSLKMKQAELDAELRKFRNHCASLRIASFNPDANFRSWCDRWFDYQQKNAPKPTASEPVAAPTPQGWADAVKRWLNDESRWPRWAGPEPTSPACRCPADVLLAAGVDPESGRLTSRLVKIVAGTDEMAALVEYRQSAKLRAPKVYTIEIDGREQTVCWAEKQWPPGYNGFGEKLQPQSEEDAA